MPTPDAENDRASPSGAPQPGPSLQGGELNAAVTSAVVGIHTTYLGRGPKSASTFHHGSYVVTVLRDVLTRAERVLVEQGGGREVQAMRLLQREVMLAEVRAAVERLTGRGVVTSVGGHEGQPDVTVEVFVLDRPL